MELNSSSDRTPRERPKKPDTEIKDLGKETPTGITAIIEQSKENIQNQAPQAPRKRGPKGPRKPKTEGGDAPGSARPSVAGPQPSVANAGAPPPDITKHLAIPIKAIGKFPAVKTGIAELALTDEESLLCAQALNEIVQAFIPDMEKLSPKAAAILGAGIVFGSIGTSKYLIYMDKRFKNVTPKTNAEVVEKPEVTEPENPRVNPEINKLSNPMDYVNGQ